MAKRPRTSLNIVHLPWDSDLFGMTVAKVPETITLTPAHLPQLMEELRALQVDFLYYFHDAQRPQDVDELRSSGFRFIDTRIILENTLRPVQVSERVPFFQLTRGGKVEVNLKPFVSMSKDLADTSRFSADPFIKKTLILRMYKSWVIKSLEFEMADYCFGLGTPSNPVAFVTFKTVRPYEVSLSLIATRRDLRRKGYGSVLLRHAFQVLHARRVHRVRVGMQLSNAGALAFYETMGFRSIGAWYIFHWHR